MEPLLRLVPPLSKAPAKVCRECGSPRLSKAKIAHRDYLCAKCNKKKIRQWEAEHPETVRERQARNNRKYRAAHPEKSLWSSALQRARKENLPFTIRVEDILIPSFCPVLGIPLQRKQGRGGGDTSPSLDRIVPSKGYVVGNIAVISNKANRIKSNATPEELELVRVWLLAALGSR